MTDKFIPVNTPLLAGNERKYLEECLDSGWISSEGPFVSRFEKEFSEAVDCNYGVAVCNGSVALDVAVGALGIGPGDEVIMPTFTIISCAAAIYRAGATPVLVDSDPLTWNMNVDLVEGLITEKTKAIMVVHIYGLPVDMDPILALAKKYSLKIIEDTAQAIGQTYRGRKCGSMGNISAFSFYPNKHITTGEGGMVTTSDQMLAGRSASLRNLCFNNAKRFVHDELGWNFRMTNFQAAVGVAQLERLPEHLERKRRYGHLYMELLRDVNELQLPLEKTDYADNLFWVFGLVLKDDVPINAAEFMSRLAKIGVGTRPFFYPMNVQPVFNKKGLFLRDKCPVSERMYERGFYLPSGLGLTEDEIRQAADAVKQVVAEL